MLTELFTLSRHFLESYNQDYVRYFLKKHRLSNRFSIITGQRGIGKTTAMVQHLVSAASGDGNSDAAIYVQADHFLVKSSSLYEIAEAFCQEGGRHICFDEIHKYPNWSQELKSIYDTFPALRITASGSSALEIQRGSHDLSRRAVSYRMSGLSFREFLELTLGLELASVNLETLLASHETLAASICRKVEAKGEKLLKLFHGYLRHGYYPFFREHPEKELYFIILEQGMHASIESDLPAVYPALTGGSIKKIEKLLAVIAQSVPFTPDMRKLKSVLDIGDERTLKTYLKYLEDAGLIRCLNRGGSGLAGMQKPDKIYLNNTNQIYAVGGETANNLGNIRETFFQNALSENYEVAVPLEGDFLVDGKQVFEIGGKNKGFSQLHGRKQSYVAADDLETGHGQIPLWCFGLLY